jgi:hypothetical protein
MVMTAIGNAIADKSYPVAGMKRGYFLPVNAGYDSKAAEYYRK